MALTKTSYSMVQGAPVNILDFGADPTGVNDSHAAITAALAFGTAPHAVYVPTGTYRVSQPIVINRGTQRFFGDGPGSIITTIGGFVGNATIRYEAYSGLIENLQIVGIVGSVDAIRVEDATLSAISKCHVRFAEAGIRLIRGNRLNWSNIYAESCNTGFLVQPSAATDTNGCTMAGLRAYDCNNFGLDVQLGASALGHLYSNWDVNCEGGLDVGARIAGGFYNNYNLYCESNVGVEYDLTASGSNYFFLKNPDNEDELFGNNGEGGFGVTSSGTNMYFDGQYAPDRVGTASFSVGGSLFGAGVKTWTVENTSSPSIQSTLVLSFLDYVPIGFRAKIYKLDNTAGFTLSSLGTSVTLIGDSGTFGAFPVGAAAVEVVKTNTSQAIVNFL